MGWIGVLFAVLVIGGTVLSIALRVPRMTKQIKDTVDNSKRWKEARENGDMIRRDRQIWREEELFYTVSSYQSVVRMIKEKDFSVCRADVFPDFEGSQLVLFKGETWNAVVEYKGEENGRNIFSFYFPAYREPVGTYLPDMNIILTQIEKIFLELDSKTQIDTRTLQYQKNRD